MSNDKSNSQLIMGAGPADRETQAESGKGSSDMLLSKKFKGMVQIFRPELPFAAGVCVILGEIIALGYFPSFQEMSLGFMCGFFLSGSAIVINDYFDLEVDRVCTEAPHPIWDGFTR